MASKDLTINQLKAENDDLKLRLAEAEEALDAIRNGEVDAIVVAGKDGDHIFSLTSVETPYRLILEQMDEGALIVGGDGTILYCNDRFAKMISTPFEKIGGSNCRKFINGYDRSKFDMLLKSGMNGKANGIIAFSKKEGRSTIYLKLSLCSLPAGIQGAVSIIADDVSYFKEKQERLEILVRNRTVDLQNKIIELLNSERALNASRESYRELVTNARSMIMKFDNEGIFTFINECALDFFGYKEEELLGQPVLKIVPETESTGRDMNKLIISFLEDPDNFSVNVNENIKKNGEIVWIEWYNKTLFNESGIKSGWIAIGIDITSRREAQEALKESEEELRTVMNASNESIYLFDKNGKVIMSNLIGISRLGKTQEEVVGQCLTEFLAPDLAAKRMQKINEVFTNALPLEFEDERASKIYHHNYFPVLKENKVSNVVTFSTDITENRKAETLLIQSEERFRTIAESLTVMVAIKSESESIISFVNEPFGKSFGFKKQELHGKVIPDIYYNYEDNKFLHDLLKVKGSVENIEVKVKKADGTPFWILLSIKKITFNSEPSYLMTSIDISETKNVQEELLRLNRTLNAHTKSGQAMLHSEDEFSYLDNVCKIIIEDSGHSMVWVGYAQNDSKKSVTPVAYYGFDKEYIDQMNITWDDSPNGRGPTGTAIKTCRSTMCKDILTDPGFEPWKKAATERGYASSLVLPLKNGERCFGAVSIYSKVPDSFSTNEIDLLNDLVDDLAHGISYIRVVESERAAARAIKENEAKLRELVITKDKFFNIVAHDLKNPFTSLLGASELLYDNISNMTTENVKKLALILNDSAKGGYAILQNLLDWSRSQTGLLRHCPSEINLRSIIEENFENLTLQASNKEITLKNELKADKIIFADRNMINTVLRNLLSNALKFTHKQGCVTVSTEFFSNEIVICVSDNGVGMSKDKIDQLFQLTNSLSMPGTEKEQGTGLGLKLCKEFTEVMGGKIWVESLQGKGSRFSFTIPLKAGTKSTVILAQVTEKEM